MIKGARISISVIQVVKRWYSGLVMIDLRWFDPRKLRSDVLDTRSQGSGGYTF